MLEPVFVKKMILAMVTEESNILSTREESPRLRVAILIRRLSTPILPKVDLPCPYAVVEPAKKDRIAKKL
jgi:hypothetical protein